MTSKSIAYEKFLDQMAEISMKAGTANEIRSEGHPVRTNEDDLPLEPGEQSLKSLFLKLTPEDREALAKLLVAERAGAMHDLAAFLDWAICCDELRIEWRGQSFPKFKGESFHHDFIGRLPENAWRGW